MRSSLLRHVSKVLTADCVALSRTLDCKRFVHRETSATRSMPKDFEDYAKRYFVFEEIELDVFRTTNLVTFRQGSSKAAYGGLVFAQALAAAENTVDETLKPHAIHSFFILTVNTTLPVQYHVRRVRDGRSFCTRTVEAIQEGKIVFTMQVSFHVLEAHLMLSSPDAAVHQDTMPNVPSWKELKSMTDLVPWLMTEITEGRIQVKPVVEKRLKYYDSRANQDEELFEIRPTNVERHLGLGDMANPTRTFYSWFKTRGDLGGCEKLHRYLVAYTTDATMAGSAYRPHHVNDFHPSMLFSLDHNVWMHKHEMRADRWMLFENTSTVAGRGRAYTTGKLWSEDGTLLLSCTQEVLLRGRGEVSRI